MGADVHYVPPKTDGTFKLNVDFHRVRSNVQPPKDAAFLTSTEWQTKSVRELLNWKQWRSESPFKFRAAYRQKYLSGRIFHPHVLLHGIAFLGLYGFIVQYGKNCNTMLNVCE